MGEGISDESKTGPDAVWYTSLGDEAAYEVSHEIKS